MAELSLLKAAVNGGGNDALGWKELLVLLDSGF
jgi:hypothetical protein